MMVRITADKKEAAATQKAVAQQEQEANEQAARVPLQCTPSFFHYFLRSFSLPFLPFFLSSLILSVFLFSVVFPFFLSSFLPFILSFCVLFPFFLSFFLSVCLSFVLPFFGACFLDSLLIFFQPPHAHFQRIVSTHNLSQTNTQKTRSTKSRDVCTYAHKHEWPLMQCKFYQPQAYWP